MAEDEDDPYVNTRAPPVTLRCAPDFSSYHSSSSSSSAFFLSFFSFLYPHPWLTANDRPRSPADWKDFFARRRQLRTRDANGRVTQADHGALFVPNRADGVP